MELINKNITPEIAHELELIKNAILAHTQVKAIYLFGSYAYGTPTSESDLDIFVIIPDNDRPIAYLRGDIRYDLFTKIRRPMDLVIDKESVYNKRRTWQSALESDIYEKGVLLYGN
jgi:predicted nucleotidyltransferase